MFIMYFKLLAMLLTCFCTV